jgi:hypothetical protein
MTWRTVHLGEIADNFISGGTPDTKKLEFWSGSIPWITGADVVDGKAIIGRRFISTSAVAGSATNVVPKGAILLVTRTGVGKMAIAETDVAISQDLTGVVLQDGFVPDFVLCAILRKVRSLQALQRGATIKGVLREALDKLAVLHCSDCKRPQAREAWDWVFQSEGFFEAYDKDAKQAMALFSNAALVRAGVAATNAAGRIVAAGTGAILNLPHKFYGDTHSEE